MRVSDTMLSRTYLSNLNRSKTQVEKLTTQIATGSKINKPSDSPSGSAKLMRLSNTTKESETYIKNIQEGLASLTETTDGLEMMLNDVESIRTLLTEIKNPVNNQYLDSYADKIDMALDSILNLANKEYNGKYLFGGTDFSNAPFGFDAGGTAIELKVPDVSGEHKIKISNNITQKINITGDELFGAIGAGDIFNTLISIRDDLNAGNLPDPADEQIIENFQGNLLDKISESGIITNRLYDSEELLNNRILALKELMSDETEVDVVEAMVDLEQQDYLLQLAYKTSSMILPKSLLDYI